MRCPSASADVAALVQFSSLLLSNHCCRRTTPLELPLGQRQGLCSNQIVVASLELVVQSISWLFSESLAEEFSSLLSLSFSSTVAHLSASCRSERVVICVVQKRTVYKAPPDGALVGYHQCLI